MENVGWGYADPSEAVAKLKDHLAFYTSEELTVVTDLTNDPAATAFGKKGPKYGLWELAVRSGSVTGPTHYSANWV